MGKLLEQYKENLKEQQEFREFVYETLNRLEKIILLSSIIIMLAICFM